MNNILVCVFFAEFFRILCDLISFYVCYDCACVLTLAYMCMHVIVSLLLTFAVRFE